MPHPQHFSLAQNLLGDPTRCWCLHWSSLPLYVLLNIDNNWLNNTGPNCKADQSVESSSCAAALSAMPLPDFSAKAAAPTSSLYDTCTGHTPLPNIHAAIVLHQPRQSAARCLGRWLRGDVSRQRQPSRLLAPLHEHSKPEGTGQRPVPPELVPFCRSQLENLHKPCKVVSPFTSVHRCYCLQRRHKSACPRHAGRKLGRRGTAPGPWQAAGGCRQCGSHGGTPAAPCRRGAPRRPLA